MPRQMNPSTTRKNMKATKTSCDRSNASKSASTQGPKKETKIPDVYQNMEDSSYFPADEDRICDYDYYYDRHYDEKY